MSKLRQKLKEGAELRLEQMLKDGGDALTEITSGANLWATDIAKLMCSKRTDTLRAKLINRLADEAETELLEKYNTQLDLTDNKGDSL